MAESTLGVYSRLLVAQARAQAQYRVSFLVDVSGSFLFAVADLIGIVIIYRVTRMLGGFDLSETLVMATLAISGFALADLAVGNIDHMRVFVRTGRLDAILVRPLGVLGQLVLSDFALRRVGRVLVTTAALALALGRAEIHWTPARALLVVIAPISAAVLFGAAFVAAATVAFWWIDSGEFSHGLTYGGRDFTAYPLPIYGPVLRALLGFAAGYAFAGYYPALVLLGRSDPLGLPGWVGWCSPGVALLAAGAAGGIWRIGIRHYRSTGS